MASSKKKKKKTKTKSRRGKQKDQTLLDLPSDLLKLVTSRLPLKDNIRASTVCKTLHEACVSVRVQDKSPWLIHFSKTHGSYEFYDPTTQKTYNLAFPELSGYRVCYSKDGWLLMYNANTFQLLFLNPFTRHRIRLPPHRMSYDQRMAFSCAPTSTTCLLFTVTNVNMSNFTVVKTCCPNAAKEWKTFVFKNRLPGNDHTFERIVFSNGVFYCLTNIGSVTIFDPCLKSWNVLPGRPRKHEGSNGCFMTEHQGKIFLIYMYSFMSPTVHRLDHTNREWTGRRTLGGLTIYASALSCESRAGQSGINNCLCLSVFRGFKRTCIYHKVDEESVICFMWKKLDPYGNIWIVPPPNLLDLPFV